MTDTSDRKPDTAEAVDAEATDDDAADSGGAAFLSGDVQDSDGAADDIDTDDADGDDSDADDSDADDSADDAQAQTLNPRKKHKSAEPVDPGETLLYEPGGSWWVVSIGPVLILAILILEIIGGGPIHWVAMLVFGGILVGFSVLQVVAARQHVSMHLTERTLRQGQVTIEISDIVKIYPENNTAEVQDWESAPAIGELHAVPRRRKGVGVRLANGRLAQAWARDVGRLRTELTEAHMAVKMGLPPRGEK